MKMVPLPQVLEFARNGVSIKQDQTSGGLPITRIETIADGKIDENKVGYAGLALDDQREKRLLPGDILFSHINSVEHIGKCAIYEGIPSPLIHGMNLLCLRPNLDLVSPKFLLYALRTNDFRVQLSRFVNRAVNQASVSVSNLSKTIIPLPPLQEQQRIAAILDAADELRTKRRESLAQLDALLQSTFLEMFGDPVTNPKGWETDEVSRLGEVVTGNTPSRERSDYYGTAIEWIKSDNINDPSFVLTPAKEGLSEAGIAVARIAPQGSILITCIAGSPSCIGNAAIADRDVAFNQQINAFIPGPRIDPWFAFGLFLLGKKLVQNASTNSMKGMVSKSAFSAIQLICPPIELQRVFASRFEAIKRQKKRLHEQLTELDTLFAAIQSRAFRGEL